MEILRANNFTEAEIQELQDIDITELEPRNFDFMRIAKFLNELNQTGAHLVQALYGLSEIPENSEDFILYIKLKQLYFAIYRCESIYDDFLPKKDMIYCDYMIARLIYATSSRPAGQNVEFDKLLDFSNILLNKPRKESENIIYSNLFDIQSNVLLLRNLFEIAIRKPIKYGDIEKTNKLLLLISLCNGCSGVIKTKITKYYQRQDNISEEYIYQELKHAQNIVIILMKD